MKIKARWLSQKEHAPTTIATMRGSRGDMVNSLLSWLMAPRTAQQRGYARAIVEAVVDWFPGTDEAWGHELMQAKLREIHQALRKSFPRGSARIIFFHVRDRHRLLDGSPLRRLPSWQARRPGTLASHATYPRKRLGGHASRCDRKIPYEAPFSPRVFVPGSSWSQTSSQKRRSAARFSCRRWLLGGIDGERAGSSSWRRPISCSRER